MLKILDIRLIIMRFIHDLSAVINRIYTNLLLDLIASNYVFNAIEFIGGNISNFCVMRINIISHSKRVRF